MFKQNLLISLAIISAADFILLKIFNNKARWFQLHALINTLVTYLIYSDAYALITNPKLPLQPRNELSDISIILVCTLHAYHFMIEKLSTISWIHHVLFVALGTIPAYMYWDNIIVALFLFTGCGLPGAIEYTMLSLVKNNYMKSLTQKRINSHINNYLRCPLSIYGIALAYINRINMSPPIPAFVYYFIFLVYLNGTFFSKLATENYMRHLTKSKIE